MGVFLFSVDISLPPPLDLALSLRPPNSNSSVSIQPMQDIYHSACRRLPPKRRDFRQSIPTQDEQNKATEKDIDLTLSLRPPNSNSSISKRPMQQNQLPPKKRDYFRQFFPTHDQRDKVMDTEINHTLSLSPPNSNSSFSRKPIKQIHHYSTSDKNSRDHFSHLPPKKRDHSQFSLGQGQQNEVKKNDTKTQKIKNKGDFTNSAINKIVQDQSIDLTLSQRPPDSNSIVPRNTNDMHSRYHIPLLPQKKLDFRKMLSAQDQHDETKKRDIRIRQENLVQKKNNCDSTNSARKNIVQDRYAVPEFIQPSQDILCKIKLPDGKYPTFMFHKELTQSDLDQGLNRLLMPRKGKEKLSSFLTEKDRSKLSNEKDGIDVFCIDQEGVKYTNMCLKHWPSMKGFVLSGVDLKFFYKNNKLMEGDYVQAWGYYKGPDFGLVLTTRNNS